MTTAIEIYKLKRANQPTTKQIQKFSILYFVIFNDISYFDDFL